MSLESFWGIFDSIQCMTLKEEHQRKVILREMFDTLNIQKAEFSEFTRHPLGSIQGNFEGHLTCMRNAYERGCQNVLIFEDDAALSRPLKKDAMDEVARFVTTNQDWDILFLGCNPCLVFEKTHSVPNYKLIYKLHSMYTHAYAVSRRYMKKILDLKFEVFEQPFDVCISLSKRSYAVFPTWFYQQNMSGTHITPNIYRPNWWMRTVVDVKTFYASKINIPLGDLIWVILLFFFILIFLLLMLLFKTY